MLRTLLIAVLLTVVLTPTAAQTPVSPDAVSPDAVSPDAFELPTELYVLSNAGQVERFGLGVAGRAVVSPADTEVIDFGVSPDGLLLAYRSTQALAVLNMLSGDAQVLDEAAGFPAFRGMGRTLAWSPDGDVLAYAVSGGLRAFYSTGGGQGLFADIPLPPALNLQWAPDGGFLAVESEGDIWWVFRREPGELVLHAALPSSRGLAWVEPGILMFAPAEGGLFLMDLNAANAQAQIGDPDTLYRLPVRVAERRMQVFARPADDARITETAGYLYEAAFVGTSWRLTPLSETSVELRGMRWSPGGALLVTLRGGVLSLVNPISAAGLPLPLTGVAAYDWGAIPAEGGDPFPLSAALYLLADDFVAGEQVWRLPASAPPATPLTQVEGGVRAYAVAPDGRTLAYADAARLFLLPADATAPVQLADDVTISGLSFALDGTQLFYDDIAADPAESRIYAQDLTEDGESTPLLTGYSAPQAVSGGLLVTLPDGDLGFYDPATGELPRLGSFRRVRDADAERLLGVGSPVSGSADGLYLLRKDGSAPPQLLLASLPGRMILDAALTQPGQARVLLGGEGAIPAPVAVYDQALAGGAAVPVGSLGYIGAPLLSPDGAYVAGYASATRSLLLRSVTGEAARVLREVPAAAGLRWVP